MTQIGLIRCEKNENRCPLTSCLRSLKTTTQGFAGYEAAELVGVFTCRCPGSGVADMAKILKRKGAEAIHFCTCTFAHKEEGAWVEGRGFCKHLENLLQQIAGEADIPCVQGTAHLPASYTPITYGAAPAGQRSA